jgi:hypothetical protein
MKPKSLFAICAATTFAAGCQDLVVENTNLPDRNRALGQPDAIELLVSSAYPGFYNRVFRGTAGYVPLPMTADVVTNSDNTSGGRDLSIIPRQPFDNNPVNDVQYSLVSLFWADLYEVYANATDALKVTDDGLVIMTGDPPTDNTHRVRTFSKLAQGIALGYIGLLFDRAFIYDEDTPDEHIADPRTHLQLVPYSEVMAKAVSLLDEAAALAEGGPDFTVPRAWLYALTDPSRDDIIEIANAYATRFLVLGPRTPQERQNVNWQSVLDHAAKVSKDVVVELGANNTGRNNNFLGRAQSTATNRFYASNFLIGPSDVSGNYQTWLATPPEQRTRFLITTPDRRITGATPTSNGRYFRYVSQDLTNPLYGTYRQSFYQFYRFNGRSTSGTFAALPLDEINLYRAEAYLRTNQTQLAVDIINQTRVTNGELPPVTTDGVSVDAACVPRTATGDCGSLMDALIYERMIELGFVDPNRTWADKRGFGTLSKGTLLHLPIPYAQLLVLGLPYYTFGGSGEGSAQ